MQDMAIRKFVYKLILLSIPILVVVAIYVYDDPFKVIRAYDSYYRSGYPSYIPLNRDYVSVETFLRHQSELQWDSFIFGNSRSLFYEVKDWSPHILSDRTFHFDAFGESLYGICRKLEFLEKRNIGIRNALIVLDTNTLSQVNNTTGHLGQKHPLLSGQGWFAFEMEYLKSFFSGCYFLAYLDFRLSHEVKQYMINADLFSTRPMDYDLRHNEIRFGAFEQMIETDPNAYYSPRERTFYSRPAMPAIFPPVILSPQKEMLEEVARILNSRHSMLRIVISPLYDQIQFNPDDLAYLKGLFGADRVYDFSGINNITHNRFNYYEDSHYRPHVAREIMSMIYHTP
jgi:hypothetical protein